MPSIRAGSSRADRHHRLARRMPPVIILCGGLGTRLREATEIRPKPMVEIGGRPILWHIMKYYAQYGLRDFLIALGYKGEVVKRYFLDHYPLNSDLTIHLGTGEVRVHGSEREDWVVQLRETGLDTKTGGRVKRLASWIGRQTFLMTYGDGVCDVDLRRLLAFHRSHGRLATVMAVRPPARFGGLKFNGELVCEFVEKPQIGEGWINGGFFILEPGVFDYIEGDQTFFEREPMERLTRDEQLVAYRHEGFWQCMDTLRDVELLEHLWQSGTAPWKIW